MLFQPEPQQESSEERVLRLCRQAATRALLAGSLVGCGHVPASEPVEGRAASPEPTSGQAEVSELAEPNETHAESLASEAAGETQGGFGEPALDALDAPYAAAPEDDPRVALPIVRSDAPNLTSTRDYQPFPCFGLPNWQDAVLTPRERVIHGAAVRSRLNAAARGLHVTQDLDYLEISQVEMTPGATLHPELSIRRFAQAGTPCASAQDQAQCARTLNQLREQERARFSCDDKVCKGGGTTFALLTRGDTVQRLRSRAEFRAVLGPIDTPTEAWLMLMVQRQVPEMECGNPQSARHRAVPGGFEITARKVTSHCVSGVSPATEKDFVYRVDASGQYSLISVRVAHHTWRCMASGRRPPGFAMTTAKGVGAAATFASMAALESASVVAFRKLARELKALGAPRVLLARCKSAARDEIRHARRVGALAQAFGATPTKPVITTTPARAALELAFENVREGCVREFYGAMLAHFQKERAEDAAVRQVFLEIAEDEARHAALALDIDAFLRTRLTHAECARVDEARRAALAELSGELSEPSRAERVSCGLPSRREAQVLLESLARAA